MSDLAANLENVHERIARSAQKSGRRGEDVTLVAVTKTVPPERLGQTLDLRLTIFGENKVQEALPKIEALTRSPLATTLSQRERDARRIEWHFIGHLQTNKAARAVEHFALIQSVDSVPLAQFLDRKAGERGKLQDMLCEIKLSPEATKSGVEPDALERFLETCSSLKNLRLRGFMTMAPFTPDAALVHQVFQEARKLFDKFQRCFGPSPILSMGMSDDFEIAIEEGSNMVRIGRALFGPREMKA